MLGDRRSPGNADFRLYNTMPVSGHSFHSQNQNLLVPTLQHIGTYSPANSGTVAANGAGNGFRTSQQATDAPFYFIQKHPFPSPSEYYSHPSPDSADQSGATRNNTSSFEQASTTIYGAPSIFVSISRSLGFNSVADSPDLGRSTLYAGSQYFYGRFHSLDQLIRAARITE